MVHKIVDHKLVYRLHFLGFQELCLPAYLTDFRKGVGIPLMRILPQNVEVKEKI
jgi:hypothetical protein